MLKLKHQQNVETSTERWGKRDAINVHHGTSKHLTLCLPLNEPKLLTFLHLDLDCFGRHHPYEQTHLVTQIFAIFAMGGDIDASNYMKSQWDDHLHKILFCNGRRIGVAHLCHLCKNPQIGKGSTWLPRTNLHQKKHSLHQWR